MVEELRGAGAEAIQFGPVRVSTSTAFVDQRPAESRWTARGSRAPYTVLAIGDPQTLDTAMQIPGGVRATARAAGGDAVVTEEQSLTISAVRSDREPELREDDRPVGFADHRRVTHDREASRWLRYPTT